jgi:hypothetical protein
MKKETETAQAAVLPASALGKAVSYTLSLWEKLTRFQEHPELELSNNWAENSMRPVVLGRKNWIHVGSEQAGPKVAAALSVVETCRRLKWRGFVRITARFSLIAIEGCGLSAQNFAVQHLRVGRIRQRVIHKSAFSPVLLRGVRRARPDSLPRRVPYVSCAACSRTRA